MNTALILPKDVTTGMTIVKRGVEALADGFISRADILKVLAVRKTGNCIAIRVCATGELIVPKDGRVRVISQG